MCLYHTNRSILITLPTRIYPSFPTFCVYISFLLFLFRLLMLFGSSAYFFFFFLFYISTSCSSQFTHKHITHVHTQKKKQKKMCYKFPASFIIRSFFFFRFSLQFTYDVCVFYSVYIVCIYQNRGVRKISFCEFRMLFRV